MLDLGFDFEGAAPLSIPTLPGGYRIQGGSGVKLRLGDKLYVAPGLHITPEVGYGYDHFFASSGYDFGPSYDWDTSRLLAGVRMEFGRIVVPSLYAHAGVGWRSSGDPTLSSSGGFAGDFGGAVDVRLWRHFQIGAYAEYAGIDATPYAPQWMGLGVHADVLF
jgi:hypothetical protein